MQKFDIAVIGLGALGSAAAWYGARKGAKVIAFEQFELGHVRGASHDTSRIVRTSYGDPAYVALAKSAYKDWAELEDAAGIKLLTVTGGLIFLPRDGATGVKDYVRSLEVNQIPCDLLNAQQVKARWPQFNIGDNVNAVYTPDSGMAHAAKSVAAMQWLARSKGALLKERVEVQRLRPQAAGQGVVIETSAGSFQARKVILATDAWTNKLLKPLDAEIPLRIMQEQVTYYKPQNTPSFHPDKFPVWIHGENPWFYGFPTFGEPTIKAARDVSENMMSIEQRTFVPSQQLEQQLTDFLDGFLPDQGRQTLRTVTCQYALTPERKFVIGPLEQHSDILVALAAGHGFKFAPAIGRVLAELAIDGKTKDDISQFGVPLKAARIQSKL